MVATKVQMRRLGRVLLNKSSPEKNRLQGCFGFLLVVYALLPGQGGNFFPFIKSRWWNSCVKNVPPCTRRTVTFVTSWINSWNPENVTQRILYKQTSLQSLLDLLLLAQSGMCMRVLPADLPDTISHEVSFYLFSHFITCGIA